MDASQSLRSKFRGNGSKGATRRKLGPACPMSGFTRMSFMVGKQRGLCRMLGSLGKGRGEEVGSLAKSSEVAQKKAVLDPAGKL